MGDFTPYFDARVGDEPPMIGIEKHDTPQPRSTYVDFALTDSDYGWAVISEDGIRTVGFGTADVMEQELGQYMRHAVTAWRAAYRDFETTLGLQFELDADPLADQPSLVAIDQRDERRTQFTFRSGGDRYDVLVSPSGIDADGIPSSVVRHAVTGWRVMHRDFTTSLSSS